MSCVPQVILIAGPMGAGKSTLAAKLALRLGRQWLSEDDFWAAEGWSGLRTPEQERLVQGKVADRLSALCRTGDGAVLELILYAEPPNPLTAYEQALRSLEVPAAVIVLRPSAAAILRRIDQRGRTDDLERRADRVRDVEHQLRVLDAECMQGYLTLDTTALSPDQTCRAALELLGG